MTPQSLLFSVMILASAGLCELSPPVNVSITSTGFIHILKWSPGPNSTNGLCYTVKVHPLSSPFTRNDTYKTVPGCKCLHSPMMCNLTEAFSDFEETYYTKIFSTLGNDSSPMVTLNPFLPFAETLLDPPLVSVSSCEGSLCVNLKPPSDFLRSVYEKFTYKLTINAKKNEFLFSRDTKGLEGETLKDLEPGMQYCVTVSIKDRNSIHSQPHCAYTASVYSAGIQFIVVVCFLVSFIGVMIILMFCGIGRLKPSLPDVLISRWSHNVVLLPSDYDMPLCSWVLVEDNMDALTHRLNDKEENDSAGSSGQAVTEKARSTAVYEQIDCISSMEGSFSSTPTSRPVSAPNTRSDFQFPSDVTENHSLSEFSTVGRSKFVLDDNLKSGSTDVGFQFYSGADITSRHSRDQCAREQGSTSGFQHGFSILESALDELETTEEEAKGSCPDINLLSVTLGKEEEELEDEDTLRLDTLLWKERSDLSVSLLTGTAGTWGSETCVSPTEEEEQDTQYSVYLRR